MTSFSFTELMKTANESDMEALPSTTGHFKAIKATAGKTGTGKDKITVRFQSLEGETKGRSFNNQFVISPDSPNALWFFFQHMAAFGLTRDGFFAGNPSVDKTAKTLINRVVWLEVGDDREWNGRKQNEIKQIAAPRNPSYTNPGVAGPASVTEMGDEDDWGTGEYDDAPQDTAEEPSPQAVATEEDMTAEEPSAPAEDDFPKPPDAPF